MPSARRSWPPPLEAHQRAHRHAELPDLVGAAELGQIDDEASETFQQRGGQSRFADTRLTRQEHHLAFAGLCLPPLWAGNAESTNPEDATMIRRGDDGGLRPRRRPSAE